jgi:hypothetical protein
MIKQKLGQFWKQDETIHEHIESLWSGFLTRNHVSLILRSHACRTVLSALHVTLSQSRVINLEGDCLLTMSLHSIRCQRHNFQHTPVV